MNILILNWRDPKNPKAGGAEKLNMHILKPFIERGDSVIWYALSVPGLPAIEMYEGLTVIRSGTTLTHFLMWPFRLWSGKFGRVDVIIDSIHGTGYMSTWIAPKTQKIILICEVAQNIWDEMYKFPINKLGKLWEKYMFRFYRSQKFWTISESTRKDLIIFGVPGSSITVLPMGFDGVGGDVTAKKYNYPSALYVGRLAEMKGIKDAVDAIASVNESLKKKWQLRVIGRGTPEYEAELKRYVNHKKLSEHITFLGFVTEKEKFIEMAKAWVLLVPSSREGWGMIVPEANSVGTPAIGYNVPGLADVLPKSAPENILIANNTKALGKTLQVIQVPVKLKKKPKPGWDKLETVVERTFPK